MYTDCVHLQPHQGKPNCLLLCIEQSSYWSTLFQDCLVILGTRLYFQSNVYLIIIYIFLIIYRDHVFNIYWPHYICWLYLELYSSTFFTYWTIVCVLFFFFAFSAIHRELFFLFRILVFCWLPVADSYSQLVPCPFTFLGCHWMNDIILMVRFTKQQIIYHLSYQGSLYDIVNICCTATWPHHIHIYILFMSFSLTVYPRILNTVPSAIL